MSDYKWAHIEPLSEADRSIDLGSMRSLYDNWRASKRRLQQSSALELMQYTRRLIRRLSVETGILERLYDLDHGTTEALVTHGFAEDLVSHSSTNIDPGQLIDILRDQEAAIQLAMDCVAQNRELTKGVMHELHRILTRHQHSTHAVDSLGNRLEIPLLKGKFKEQPNNPKRQDGALHEYCPPIHVEAEVENLLGWLAGYSNDDPILVATWLHHRFTQIHPYQDGNGRLARALTTMILLRAELLPLVIDRNLRTEYIQALEQADSGDLSTLARIFARLERHAILQALSVDVDAEVAHRQSLTSAVIGSLADKFNKRRSRKLDELRNVNIVALDLRSRAKNAIEKSLGDLATAIRAAGEATYRVQDGGSDRNNAHWYKFEVGRSAQDAGQFANFAENHYFVKGSVKVANERLIFIVSFHHVGRELTGIMEATAFSKIESFEDSEDRESVSGDFLLCSTEPFVFTNQTKAGEIADAFERWLDASVAIALKGFGDRL